MGFSASAGFGFGGRIGRTQFWAQLLVVALGVGLLREVAAGLAFLNTGSPHFATTFFADVLGVVTMLGYLLLTLAGYGLVFATMVGFASTIVCRLRDRGRGGWWLLVYVVAACQLSTDTSLWQGTPTLASLSVVALLVWGAIELGVLPGRPDIPSAALV
jgi:uncharacterized membrane protein YhaH (DUF805 family)